MFIIFDYIQDVLDEFPEEFHGKAKTLASYHIFDVDKESEKLN